MSYKSLLLYVDGGEGRGAVFDHGLRLADWFDAHVTGLNVHLPSYQAFAVYGGYAVGDGGVMERLDAEARDLADRLRDEFLGRARRTGCAKAEWRYVEGETAGSISVNARYADLVIMPCKDPDDANSLGTPELPAHVALGCARPVLVLPAAAPVDTFGRHVLLAWNATREATRAATAALPLMKRAGRVTIAVVDEGRRMDTAHGDVPGADIALYLARHGINAEVMQLSKGGSEVSDVLLSTAADRGADLLCMGAYGHSRWRELALGGTTHDILRSMTVPTMLVC
ncbi:MAG TPA: universal stress protein [Gammaproteobacteria bacterium]|nr:universal stress protein [Gammaproteobacteria bacterium]